jgi:hypothetical protein
MSTFNKGRLVTQDPELISELENHPRCRLNPAMQYARTLVQMHYPQHEFNGHAKVMDRKLIVAVTTGIVIFPEDMSYRHFVNNSWYD